MKGVTGNSKIRLHLYIINVGILVLSLPGARKVHEERNTISFGGKGALDKWCLQTAPWGVPSKRYIDLW